MGEEEENGRLYLFIFSPVLRLRYSIIPEPLLPPCGSASHSLPPCHIQMPLQKRVRETKQSEDMGIQFSI